MRRVEVPIRQVVLSAGTTRYTVPLTIGSGEPIEAVLDTGSTGVRVLADGLSRSRYRATAIGRQYPFGAGVLFKGVLAEAELAVGEARGSGPRFFHLIEEVGCAPHFPDCAAADIDRADYRIGGLGVPREGFWALVGLALRRPPTPLAAENPLVAAGVTRWIIELPRPGSSDPGRLIVEPTDEDVDGFTLLRVPPAPRLDDGRSGGWRDGALSGRLVDERSGETYSGATMLDTGVPGFVLLQSRHAPEPNLPEGTAARFELDVGEHTVALPFVVGRDWAVRFETIATPGDGPPRLFAGPLFFFHHAVLYDAASGTVGIRPRDGTTPIRAS